MIDKTARPATAPVLLTGCSGGGKSTLLAALRCSLEHLLAKKDEYLAKISPGALLCVRYG